MKSKNIIITVGAAALCLLLVACAIAVDRAKSEKRRYIESSNELARNDLADAAEMLEAAILSGDKEAAIHAAGLAEAYLSRAGIENCGALYAIISGICEGEYGIETCEEFLNAVKKARDGDGGAALRALADNSAPETDPLSAETTEDALSARVMKRLGRGNDDIAEKKARAFCCPNAVFERCVCDIPASYKYSGDNIFVAVEGERAHVTLYCFDRELDERYTVTSEDAMHTVDMIVKKEKLRLEGEPDFIRENGLYRFTYPSEDGSALVTIEIYSDTGRLRKYDAVNYYSKIN